MGMILTADASRIAAPPLKKRLELRRLVVGDGGDPEAVAQVRQRVRRVELVQGSFLAADQPPADVGLGQPGRELRDALLDDPCGPDTDQR